MRRHTTQVLVGDITIGGNAPVRIQSMASVPTDHVALAVEQAKRIIGSGAELLRFTTQGLKQVESLGKIRSALRAENITTPLVADIHFNPKAAFEAAIKIEKVRINPGNFIDPGRTFHIIEYDDATYATELDRLEKQLIPFIELCRKHGTAIRLGVNHGSLSDRIMSRYGDTPHGMVESAMEFLRVFRKHSFDNVVISIKASNVVVMTHTVRLLVQAMDNEDMHYPLHLGVTEAGDGEDGRIKSAVGIGSLLADGIGDTIRVSLSEEPEYEIPVARMILKHIDEAKPLATDINEPQTTPKRKLPIPLVAGVDKLPTHVESHTFSGRSVISDTISCLSANTSESPQQITISYPSHLSPEEILIAASIDLGSILLKGYADIIDIDAPQLSYDERKDLLLGILQATRLRMTKTEYIACPSCGRTLFDLQDTLKEIKAATSHLKGLKIGVMGCIVNGPGEMADADYGYVGGAIGKVSLYKGKECVEKNIPTNEAVFRLIQLIKSHNDWIDP